LGRRSKYLRAGTGADSPLVRLFRDRLRD
jgi:hypothetical protein